MTLIAYYALNEAAMDAPAVATDSSGNGFNGAYYGPDAYGANSPVPGHLNNGMEVLVPATYPDPADLLGHAGMRVQAVTDFSFALNDPFTVDFWVKLGATDPIQTRALIGSYNPAVPPGEYSSWGFWIGGGLTSVRFFRGNFNVVTPHLDEVVTPSLTPGTWYELRGEYDGTTMSVSVDGTLEDSMAATVTDLSAAASSLSVGGGVPLGVIFGQKSFRYPPNGTVLDEVYVYDSVPSSGSATVAFYGGEATA